MSRPPTTTAILSPGHAFGHHRPLKPQHQPRGHWARTDLQGHVLTRRWRDLHHAEPHSPTRHAEGLLVGPRLMPMS